MKKIFIIILSVLLTISIGFDIYLIYDNHHKKEPPLLTPVPYQHFNMPLEPIETNLTKHEIRQMLNSLYDVKYTYQESEFNDKTLATINGNKITINSTIDTIEYITVLSHELTHLKYKTNNDTFTEYTSLITLYESNIPLFQKASLNKAKLIISGAYENTEYDCGYYLLNYFTFL